MKTKLILKFVWLCLLPFVLHLPAYGQGTAFTYQGRLNDGANPATGGYDLTFCVWTAANGSEQVGDKLTSANTAVSNGLFTVTLDFGNQFPGADRWLEIAVRTNGGDVFTTLNPRQKLTATPHAITAGNVTGTIAAAQLGGQVTGVQIANGAVGAAQADGAQVQLRVTGTAPDGQFITGINANGSVATTSDSTDWKLGGNSVAPGQFIGSTNNQPLEFRINGLRALRIEPRAGGYPNLIGGANSVVGVGADAATIAGGYNNMANGTFATIGGGNENMASHNNTAIGGGEANAATNVYATVPGGYLNVAGGWGSLAAGQQAKALHDGAFVWADNQGGDFASTRSNQFLIRAGGGLGINTNDPNGAALNIAGTLVATTVQSGSFTGNGGGLTNVPGTFVWQAVGGKSQQALPNHGYFAGNDERVTISLPTSPNVGDTLRVAGIGAGGWRIAQNAGQRVLTPSILPTNTTAIQNWRDVASSSDGSKLVAVMHGGQIYTSTDSGVTWTPRDTNRNWRSVASSSDGTKLVALDFQGQIYTSTDSGVTWTPRDIERFWWSVASSSDGTKLVAVEIGRQIYTSTDSGVTWTPRDTNRDWRSVASSADGSKLVAVVELGLIYTSTDSGVTWWPPPQQGTTQGILGSITGEQSTSMELLYVGGGQFLVLTFGGGAIRVN